MDKHAAVLSKVPEVASLSRNLRAFIAANARAFDCGADAGSAAVSGSVAGGGLSLGGGGHGPECEAMSADASHAERDARGGAAR
jgi:hypothetical protein